MSKLNTMPYPQMRNALSLSSGRNIRTADRLEMTDFGDCCRNDFWWSDGACFSMLHDTRDEAITEALLAGFL